MTAGRLQLVSMRVDSGAGARCSTLRPDAVRPEFLSGKQSADNPTRSVGREEPGDEGHRPPRAPRSETFGYEEG